MNIVLEGFDGSGKTTLGQTLAEEFDLTYVWATGPPENLDQAMELCHEQLSMENKVFDRITPISTLCYGSIPLNQNIVKIFGHYIQIMTLRDFIFIYCTGKGEIVYDKDHDTKDYQRFLEVNRHTIEATYTRLFTTIRHFKFDFQKQSYEEVVKWINMQRLQQKPF